MYTDSGCVRDVYLFRQSSLLRYVGLGGGFGWFFGLMDWILGEGIQGSGIVVFWGGGSKWLLFGRWECPFFFSSFLIFLLLFLVVVLLFEWEIYSVVSTLYGALYVCMCMCNDVGSRMLDHANAICNTLIPSTYIQMI